MTVIDAGPLLTSTGRAYLAVRAERDQLAAQLRRIEAALTGQQQYLAAGNHQQTRIAEDALAAVRLAGWPAATSGETTR